MTGSLRSSARNPISIALMGILILVFLILGVGGGGRFPDAFRQVAPDSVVSAGSHSVSKQDFKRIFDQQKDRYQQQTGQPVTTEFLVQNGADGQMLSEISLEQAGLEMLKRAGIDPAPALVDAEIKKLPFAFDKVTGQFSQAQFTQALAAQGLTPKQAAAEIADELAERHFGYALEAGYKIPRLYSAVDAVAGLESRDVSYFVMGIHAVPMPAAPTDAQLLAFMKQHAAQLTLPEMRVITLVKFSAKDIAPSIKVDPAEVAKEFAFRKDTLTNPERRTVIEIPVKSAQQAALAEQGLAGGQDPAIIAKAIGSEPVSYVDKPQSAFADAKMAQAAFAMKAGSVSGPVRGDLGAAVLKVIKVTPGGAVTLQSATPQIEADLRQKAAAKKAYDQSKAFDDARQGGMSIADAARKVGAMSLTLPPISAQGQNVDGQPIPAVNDTIAKAAFAQAAGQDGDLQDSGAGEYFALRVEKVLAPALPPLDAKRPQLTQAYMNTQLVTALKAKALALIDQIKKGESLDAAASSVGAQVVHQADMQRIKAEQYKPLGQEFLENVFGQKPGAVFAAGGQTGIYIAKVDSVRPGDVTQTAQLLEVLRPRVTQAYLKDLLVTANTAARADLKVSINQTLARQELGVDPALIGPAPAAKAGQTAK